MTSNQFVINNSAKAYLLDTSQPFNEEKVKLLDEVVNALYGNDTSMVDEANKIMTKLQKDNKLWQNCDFILDHAQNINTKFFALIILEENITLRWNLIPVNQRESIRKYIVELVLKMANNNLATSQLQHFLNKANSIIVSILKKEYNTSWSSFIADMCEASKANQALCENTLNLFRILSEEVFEFPKHKLSSAKANELKTKLTIEFEKIYELCYFVLTGYFQNTEAVSQSMVMSCLKTLLAYLNWIPISYLYLTNLTTMLLKLFDNPVFRAIVLSCFTEMATVSIDQFEGEIGLQYQQKIFEFFTNFLTKLNELLPVKVNLYQEREKLLQNPPAYASQLFTLDTLCKKASLVIVGFLKTHLLWIERLALTSSNTDAAIVVQVLRSAVHYLVNLTNIREEHVVKICIEYWEQFTAQLRRKIEQNCPELVTQIEVGGEVGTLFQLIYQPALNLLRKIATKWIEKPPEVTFIIKKNGEIEEADSNTDSSTFFETCKDLIVNLTILDWTEMKAAFIGTLETQIDGTEWSTDNMNHLCWSVGCIGGVLSEEEERNFAMLFLRTLLSLCEQKKEQEKKIVVASNIIYLSSKFPRMLKRNFNFLTILTKKLFEFMLEPVPLLSMMACKTFLKIADICSKEFVDKEIKTEMNSSPLILEILQTFPKILQQLQSQQRLMLFTAIGHILSAEDDITTFNTYLELCLGDTIQKWRLIVSEANQNSDVLENEQTIIELMEIIKIFHSLAKSSKDTFMMCSANITQEAVKLYEYYSKRLSQEVAAKNTSALYQPKGKKIRLFRKEIIQLLQSHTDRFENVEMFAKLYLPVLKQIIADYTSGLPDSREPSVLSLCAKTVSKCGMNLGQENISGILITALNFVIPVIKNDFNSLMDHRTRLFELILATIVHGFDAVIMIKAENFKDVVDTLLWGIKHKQPTISDYALEAMYRMLESFNGNIQHANKFYEVFFLRIFDVIIGVLTDTYHKSGFPKQSRIIGLLFELIEKNVLNVAISKDVINFNNSNKEFLKSYAQNLFTKSFKMLSTQQCSLFIDELFKNSNDFVHFKSMLKEFIASLSEYSQELAELQLEPTK